MLFPCGVYPSLHLMLLPCRGRPATHPSSSAANDETSKLTIEDLRDMLNNIDDDP